MKKRYLLLPIFLSLVGLPSAMLAQPAGPEFQVNSYTTNPQYGASIASDASGNFVVVWESYGQDGSFEGVFGQRYDGSGKPVGGEFQVNTYITSYQVAPSVASDASGNFVVVWNSYGQDGSNWGAFGQRYDSGGNPLGGEFPVNTYTTNYQNGSDVASDASGNFVVTWGSNGQDGSYFGVFGQRYDRGGMPLGGEFQVNTYTTYDQTLPSVASDATGNFVVVWQSFEQDRSVWGVFGQRYDSNGNTLGAEFQVNTYTRSIQDLPSVASDASGNFVVVWTSHYQDGSFPGIFGQRYDSSGSPLGGEFQVNAYTRNSQYRPSVASDASGNFVVVWQSYPGQDGSSGGVFGQRYDSSGNPLGGEFQVNTYTTYSQGYASVASDTSGNFVVVWQSFLQDGSLGGVFGQRFSAACEASVEVPGDVHTPGGILPVRVHIAHHRPRTVSVPWEMRLLDASEQVIAKHTTRPHTIEPGDVVDRDVEFRLPDELATGTYTLELGISGMAGTKGATTTLRVVRAE